MRKSPNTTSQQKGRKVMTGFSVGKTQTKPYNTTATKAKPKVQQRSFQQNVM